jgi:tetratricopeptide (TPR) repeat protein
MDEAFAECRKLIEQDRSFDSLFLAAGLLTEKNLFPEAMGLLEEAVGQQSVHGDAHRELARLILAGKGSGDLSRAAALARSAVEKSPAAANYDVLAWALFASGDIDGAVDSIETALRLEPDNPDFQKRLAELKRRRGR